MISGIVRVVLETMQDAGRLFCLRCPQMRSKYPGLPVLDLAMPGLNGLDLQEALAARGSLLPIIFLTGHGDLSSAVTAMKRGAVDFLTKPVDAADLIATVCGPIEKDRVARQCHAELAEIKDRFASLTPREYEVLCHVVSGKLKAGQGKGTFRLVESRGQGLRPQNDKWLVTVPNDFWG